jgi:phosphopantetheine adenylyltransferase
MFTKDDKCVEKEKKTNKKNKKVINFLAAIIEEREHLIKLLGKTGSCKIFKRSFLPILSAKKIPGLIQVNNERRASGAYDLEICDAIEEFAFQVDQCRFAASLLVPKKEESGEEKKESSEKLAEKYEDVRKILSRIRDVTYSLPVPIDCKQVSPLYSLKEVRLSQFEEMIDFLLN